MVNCSSVKRTPRPKSAECVKTARPRSTSVHNRPHWRPTGGNVYTRPHTPLETRPKSVECPMREEVYCSPPIYCVPQPSKTTEFCYSLPQQPTKATEFCYSLPCEPLYTVCTPAKTTIKTTVNTYKQYKKKNF